jgi:lipopolysaccharide/colanic/teichoic acid biosynthesis glycosyltransferase
MAHPVLPFFRVPAEIKFPNRDQVDWMWQATIAALAVLVLSPLFVLVAAIVFLQDGGPVFFAHQRVGYRNKPFRCMKFRTMVVDAETRLQALLESDPAAREEWERDHKLRRDPRITPLGELLRRSSLDELPQLINVIRGEMSLVGPRPIVQAEVPRYGRRIHYYYAVRPGITGLWQVSGRNDVCYRTRVAMDCVYARRRSALLDVQLLVLTVPAVLVRKGSY